MKNKEVRKCQLPTASGLEEVGENEDGDRSPTEERGEVPDRGLRLEDINDLDI